MQIVNIKQGTPEWHEWRAGGLGGSDMGAVFGISRFKTRHQLWLEKTGFVKPEAPKSDFILKRGHKVEPIMRAYASEQLGEEIAVTCVQGDLPWQRVSLDGITLDGEIVVECKLLGRDAFEMLRDHQIVPKEYWPQLAHQITTAGAERALFVGHNDALGESAHAMVLGAQVCGSFDTVPAGEAFWLAVCSREEPEPLGNEIIVRDDSEWASLAQRVIAAKAAKAEAEKEEKAAADALKKLAGEARRVEGCGVGITRFWKQGTVDYAKIPELASVDLEAYRKKGGFQQTLTVARAAS